MWMEDLLEVSDSNVASTFVQINTCNGYYCDQWTPNDKTKPIFWTEDWNGWYYTPFQAGHL